MPLSPGWFRVKSSRNGLLLAGERARELARSMPKEKHNMPNTLRRLVVLLAFLVSALPGANEGPKSGKSAAAELGHGAKAALWREPTDIASRNLLYGSGGAGRQPRGPFTFIEEDMEGSNPKF